MDNGKLLALAEPMPYKWKIQSINQYKCTLVAYIDARDVMNRLDEVVGPMNWENSYDEYSGSLFCGISIMKEKGYVTKWDCGTESNVEKEKGQASDAFKRAAVHWGIGRFLYSLTPYVIPETKQYKNNKWYPSTGGDIIWNIDEWVQGKVQQCLEFIDSKLSPLTSMADATPLIENMGTHAWWNLNVHALQERVQDHIDLINARENGDR